MSLEMWSQVKKFSDGESLNAETLNVPIGQLGDRTSFLYSRLKELINGDKMSSIIITGVELETGDGLEPSVGNAVYLDNDSGRFAMAKASMSLYDDFTAAESAFTVGILVSKDGTIGNVLAYGTLNLNPDGSPILVENMIESGEEFRPGRYYLSSNEAGRLSAHPKGPLIYVCTISGNIKEGAEGPAFDSGTAIVTPQFLDIGTSHVHRSAVLVAKPAGTLSTQGYLPKSYDEDHPEWSPSLRFGGTWELDRSVVYEFFLDQTSANWPTGLTLRWKENGIESDDFHVDIHAPDEEVKISHGLTARLSLPMSTSTNAYSGLSQDDQRTWEALEFPDAGKGWLDHEGFSVAVQPDIPALKVAVRGRFDYSPMEVNVAFPESTQIVGVNTITEGTTFTYNETVYEFTKDVDNFTSDDGNIPVALGTCAADSLHFLADALDKNRSEDDSSSKFAVFEQNGGQTASLLVMDGVEVDDTQTVVSGVVEKTQLAFDVRGAIEVKSVIYDGYRRVISDSAVVEYMQSYMWNSAGDIYVMIYQTSSGTVTVPTGTVTHAVVNDYEPDALYDYVIGMDAKVSNFWPPVPVKSAALMVNGVEMDNKALFPKNPTVSFGRDTIHWFEDDADRKPWPEAFTRRDAYINPALDKTEVLNWVRSFQCATGPVTSLQVREGSPIKVYGYGTDEVANTGDLEIVADFDFTVENGGVPGFLVPKRGIGGRLMAGPVVERIIGGAGVSVISMAGCPQGQGSVIVALDNGSYRNLFSDIALENAEQAKIGMFPYVRLRGYQQSLTSPSAFTAMMRVPDSLPDGTYELKLQASVFGEVGFSGSSKQAACVKLEYNILPDYNAESGKGYSNLKTGLLKPDVERTVVIPFGHDSGEGIAYDGFDPILLMTDDDAIKDEDDVVQKVLGSALPSASEFAMQSVVPELRPGYLVGIRISRAVPQGTNLTPYTAALGFINMSWSLVATQESWSKATASSSPLDGVEIRANTPSGIRTAVETMGERLGASVIKTSRSSRSSRR